MDECLQGDLIRGRTVLLVVSRVKHIFLYSHLNMSRYFQTHNVALTSPIADNIIQVGLDGVAHEIGTDISAVLVHDPDLAKEVEQEEEEAEMEAAVIDKVVKEADKPDGKLILAEEIAEGRVTWRSMMLFLKGLGGNNPVFFMTAWMTGIALMHGGSMLGVWFLGFWGSQYETHAPEDVDVKLYVSFHFPPVLFTSTNTFLL